MPPLFKDFAKDAKDLVEKNYSEAGSWKIESKFKGADSTFFINPNVEKAKGKKPAPGSPAAAFDEYDVKMDVEYNVKAYGLKTKTTVSSKKTVEPQVTYEADGHKVELVVAKRELSYEYKAGKFALNDKLTENGVNVGVAYEVANGISVGVEADYGFKTYAVDSWAAGAQYKDKNVTVSVSTKALKNYVTGIIAPINGTPLPNLKLACYADCVAKHDDKNKTKVNVGAEFGCPFGSGFVLRVKVDNSFKASLAAIRKFGDGWKAAFSLDSSFKGVGVILSRE